PRVVELGRAHDLVEDRLDTIREGHGKHDLLLGLDGHPEDLLLLVDAGTATKQHRAAARAGFDGGFEHGAAPALADDRYDQRGIRHFTTPNYVFSSGREGQSS